MSSMRKTRRKEPTELERRRREEHIYYYQRRRKQAEDAVVRDYGEEMIGSSLKRLVKTDGDGGKIAFDSIEDDSCCAISSQFRPNLSYAVISKFRNVFIGWQNCAILMQNAIISNACTLPAQKAMMVGYKLGYLEKGKKDSDGKLDHLEEISQSKYKIQDVCVQSAINAFQYGYSLTVPTFKEDVDMSTPFDISLVKKGSYTGMATIEPYWIVPQLEGEDLVDSWSKHFFEPTYYDINGRKRIHRSWCIKNIPYPVGDILKPKYLYGGVPLTQMIYEDVYAYEKAVNELNQLLLTKRTVCIEGDMFNAITNPEEFNQKMRVSSDSKDNYGILAVDMESNVKQFDTTLAGMYEVIECLQDRLCAKTQMSPADLFKKIIKGGSNSGAGKFERYDVNNRLEKIQLSQYLPIIDFHNKLMTKSEFGKEIELKTIFNPIDSPDEMTRAQISDLKTKSAMMRVGAHLTTREEERERMANDPNEGWVNLDPELPPQLKEIDAQFVDSPDQLDNSFSAEKDNQGRPLPKPLTTGNRVPSKRDIRRKKEIENRNDGE